MVKQVVIDSPYHVSLRDAPFPVCGEDEVLLKLRCGGICGTDMSVYRGALSGTLVSTSYPRISGHEYSAEVAAVGANVKDMAVGELVTGNPYYNCGSCYSCRRGLVNCCTSNATCGVQRDGVFSQYFTMPRQRLYSGDGLDSAVLALMEPMSIGYHALRRAAVKAGERVLIVGAGTIGVLTAIAALHEGAEVTICDVAEEKLRLAGIYGIQHVILNNGDRPLADYVAQYTGGDGYDVLIECAGLPQTVQDCVDSAAFGGRIAIIGVVKHPFEFNVDIIRHKYLDILGARNAVDADFQDSIALALTGKYPLERLISRSFPYEQAAEAYDYFDKNGSNAFKIMLHFA